MLLGPGTRRAAVLGKCALCITMKCGNAVTTYTVTVLLSFFTFLNLFINYLCFDCQSFGNVFLNVLIWIFLKILIYFY